MNFPQVIKDLVNANNDFDSTAFADCFSETAIAFDEGKTHTGKADIKNWIEKAMKEYSASMKPVDFEGDAEKGILKAEISGNFPGSPLILTYDFKFQNEKIESLRIS
ncbi:nuclear transport factor 2 family protein [Flavobacterium sp.]|uniref:nuclear transport factor 2 family protein n=1 Tax=Flavobacterium sp. TaxID=239 RepID=UPI0031D72050